MNKMLATFALAGAVVSGLACTPQNTSQSTAPSTAPTVARSTAQGTSQPALTEGHARAAMLGFGCSNLSSLGRGPAGSWHGQCTKSGQLVTAVMDREGKVTASAASDYVTEGGARAAMLQAGCSNLSTLAMNDDGTWRAMCTKGGRTVNASVDGQGKATTN